MGTPKSPTMVREIPSLFVEMKMGVRQNYVRGGEEAHDFTLRRIKGKSKC